MPKEIFNDGSFDAVVGWDHGYTIQLGVDSHRDFEFLDTDSSDREGPFTSLWFTFYSTEEVNRFIKVLHKAKRKAFQ